jgi:hypothetical protein
LSASNIVSNERVGDEIDTIDSGIIHVPRPRTPKTASKKKSSLPTNEDSDSGIEESNISQIINAGPVTQPPTITRRFLSSSGKLCSILSIECHLFNIVFFYQF